MAAAAEDEKAKDRLLQIQGPVSYTYCRFKVNGRPRIIHMFGDVHVNVSSCHDQRSISLDKLIKNTIEHYRGEKTIDVFVERGFGKLESRIGQTDDYEYHSDTMPYIETLFRRFERDGCFHRPRDARCKQKYPNARFHNIDFRQTLHADVLSFLKEYVNGFTLSVEDEQKIQNLRTWFRQYDDEVEKQLNQVIQANINTLKSLVRDPAAFNAYKLSKTNKYDERLYSNDDRDTVVANVQDHTLANQTMEYKDFLENHFQNMLKNYETKIQEISTTLYSIAESFSVEHGVNPRLKSMALWVRYLFQNFLYSEIMTLIRILRAQNIKAIDKIFGDLRNINVLINLFKPLDDTFNFLGILFYSIKMENAIPPKQAPYYEYLLLHSAEKTVDQNVRKMLVDTLKDTILPNIRKPPGTPEGIAFMRMDYMSRLFNSAMAVPITSLFLDLYTIIRAIKSEDFSNVIGYVGAGHITNQRAFLNIFRGKGVITDVVFTEIGKSSLSKIEQCVTIPLKMLGGIFYLPFEWIEIGENHYLGTGNPVVDIGSVPIARDLDTKRYIQSDFVSQDEYAHYKKMNETEQEFYLSQRDMISLDQRESFAKGFAYAIKKYGIDRVRQKINEDNETINLISRGERDIIDVLFLEHSFRPKRSTRTKKSSTRKKRSTRTKKSSTRTKKSSTRKKRS